MKKSIFLFFAAILCAMSASAWSYKSDANGWKASTSGFTTVTMNSGKSMSVVMLKDVGDGVNICQNDDGNGQKLYCKWTKTSGDIFRGTARWNSGLYSDETVVIPGGIVYIKVGSGAQVQMTAGADYTYTADVTFSNTGESYTISGGTVSGATINNESGMPAGGKPASLTMSNSYTSKNAGNVHIVFDLKTNKVTETADSEPEPVADVTVHVINSAKWAAVACYHWGEGGAGTEWPGDVLSKTNEFAGYDVYTATFTGEHTSCIFNNNNNGKQTGDLTVQNGQYYDLKSNKWYASLAEVPAPDPLATDVFLAGSMNGWSTTANEFKKVEEGSATATLTMNLEAETEYEFKVVREGAWTSSKENRDIKGSVSELVFSSSTADNTKMTTTVAGDYVFTWNDSKLSITYPASTEPDPTPDPAETETVYFVNADDWTGTIYAYAWKDGDPKVENAPWAGVAAQKEANQIGGHDVYSYTAEKGKYANVIFNNNSGNQTSDMTWTADQYLCKNEWCADEDAVLAKLNGPIEYETVYFVNADDWTGTIYAYAFADGGNTKNAGWPGEVAQKEANQIGGHDVYSYTAEKGKYETVIFNNNSSNQTSDMTWAANQYLCKNEWCADEAAVLAKLNGPVEYVSVYFINTVDWSAVNIYTWSPEVAKWPGVAMTKEAEQIAGFDVYSYTVEKGTTFGGMKFNENGGNQTGDLQWTAGKYYIYNYGPVIGWFTKEEAIANLTEPVVTYDYYIAGNEALLGADKNWGSTPAGKGMDKGADGLYTATFTLSANTEYEFKITDGQWNSESDNSHEHTTLAAVYVGVTGGNGNNIKVNLAEAKELTITFNSTEDKIYFNLDEETASLTYRVQVPEGTEACYIAGPCNSWAFREMTREGTTDIFTIDIVGAKETDEYKYACQADWAYAEVIDGGGNRTAWQELDQVEEWGKPVVVTYQLKGVGGWETEGIELVQNPENDKEYMLTCQAISAADAIKVVRLEDGVIKDYYGNGTVKDAVEVTVNYDGDGNITLPEGTYNFYFDTNEPEKKLWIASATDCETEPTTVTLTYDLTTDAVSNKLGRRYVTAEDATLGNVQIILPSFNTETTEYTDASLGVGDETLDATATYTADTDNNKETYTATATSEDGTTTYNVTMTIIVPATQTYTFLATIGAEATVNEYEWGTEYSINGSGYLDDTPVEFEGL